MTVMSRVLAYLSQLLCGLRGHSMVLHFEPNRLALQCLSCGKQTPGWVFNESAACPRPAPRAHVTRRLELVPRRAA